jgi:hypothetical protein
MAGLRKRSEAAAELAAKMVTPTADTAASNEAVSKAMFDRPAVVPTPPPLFASANSWQGPGVHPDFERIVETIYQTDAFKDYVDLESSLEVGDQRGDYRTLTEHLDKAERRARRAHALYLGAKLERARWEMDSEVTLAGMRTKASDELEEEKDRGERKKAITDADVRARMAELFPDEWRHQELKRVKLKGTEEHLERLADLWKVKCFSLSTMLSNLRK